MYTHVFLGGTFDRIHKGHGAMLARAFAVGDRVTIGLTSDEFVKKFRIQNEEFRIEDYAKRKNTLLQWLQQHEFENRASVIAIDDPYEPAASMNDLDAIMVTPDNKVRGEEINTRRKSKGLSELTLVEVPLVPAQDAKPISAMRIRNGEIDTAGRLTLPDNLRPELAKPIGPVLVGDAIGSSIEAHRNGIVVAVGDITAKIFLTAGVIPSLSIVDFQVARKPYPYLDAKFTERNIFRITVASGPGFITDEAVQCIQKWATHPADKTVLVVRGEEDLLALPAVAYGPPGAVVYYGQPGIGMVEVVITAEKKNEAIALLERFSVK